MTFVNDDGEVLDFDGTFAITKRAVSILDSKIKGDISITFQVANNSVTRKVLNYDGPMMLDQVAFTRQPFTLMRNGNPFVRGFIVIQRDQGSTLSCFFISGNSNWINLLDGLITELDYTGVTNVTNYETQIPPSSFFGFTSGVTYPLVDWSYNLNQGANYFAGNVLDVSADQTNVHFDQYPCFFLHSLITEIVKQNGLKISGDIVDNVVYKNMVLTPIRGDIRRPDVKIVTAYGAAQTTSSATPVQYTQLTQGSDPDGLFASNVYTAAKSTKIIFTVVVKSVTGTGSFNGTVSLRRNSVVISTITDLGGPVGGVVDGGIGTYTIPINSSAVNVSDQFDLAIQLVTGTDITLSLDFKIGIKTQMIGQDRVLPNYFLPPIKSVDIIKFIVNYFGCSVYYDALSKTLSINQIEAMQPEDADDWSAYVKSIQVDYVTTAASNNYMRLLKSSDPEIKAYNKGNTVRYGEGNITTDITSKTDADLFTIPFAASQFSISKNGFWLCNVPLVKLTDTTPFNYTSVADDGSGNAVFSFAGVAALAVNQAVRVVDDIAGDAGIFIVAASSEAAGVVTVEFFGYPYPGVTGTGKLYPQQREFNEIEPRILILNYSLSPSEIKDDGAEVDIQGSPVSSIDVAYFTKPNTGLGIDNRKSNLALENPQDAQFSDPTIKELYFSKISKMIGNPTFGAEMILPESVFQGFKFDRFIYLKTKDLTGYFWVDSIDQYVDSVTPVNVKLLML